MDFRKIFLISVIFLLALSFVCASETSDDVQFESVPADDLIEIDNADEDVVSVAEDASFKDLQDKISNASDGDVIDLDMNYSFTGGDSCDGIVIDKSLTINGNGMKLDAKHASRIFAVGNTEKTSTITLKNLIFINGYSDSGSAVHIIMQSKSIFLQIDNCTFENNVARVNGGAIDSYNELRSDGSVMAATSNSYFKITNSRFINNSAVNGGAVYSQGISTEVSNSVFKNNVANDGGALNINDDEGMVMSGSVFESNRAVIPSYGSGGTGGAISYSSARPFLILNCNFTDNTGVYGGAILFSCNYEFCKIINSIFKLNFASKSGGAISCKSEMILENSIFENNNLPELEIQYEMDYSPEYLSNKDFKVKIINTITKKPVKDVEIKLYVKISTGTKKYQTKIFTAVTDENGIATFKISKLSKYDYYGILYLSKSYSFVNKTTEYGFFNDFNTYNSEESLAFKIKKIKTKVKANKLTAKFKKSKYFKVKVTYNKKAVKKIKIKLKIYSGKKYRTYTVKTNNKGVAKFNTKKLSKGKHKVLIITGNKYYNYKINGKSKITIK